MNMETNDENQAEKEVLEVLQKSCRVMRSNRTRPELAGPASRWELKIKQRLDEILATETPSLPLKKAVAA